MTMVHNQVAKLSFVLLFMSPLFGCTNKSNDEAILKIYPSRENAKIVTDSDSTVSKNVEQEMKSCKTLKGIALEYCRIDLNLTCRSVNNVEHCIQYNIDKSALVWGPY